MNKCCLLACLLACFDTMHGIYIRRNKYISGNKWRLGCWQRFFFFNELLVQQRKKCCHWRTYTHTETDFYAVSLPFCWIFLYWELVIDKIWRKGWIINFWFKWKIKMFFQFEKSDLFLLLMMMLYGRTVLDEYSHSHTYTTHTHLHTNTPSSFPLNVICQM